MLRDLVSKLTLPGEASWWSLVRLAYRRAANVGQDRKGRRWSGRDLRVWCLGRSSITGVDGGDVWSTGQGSWRSGVAG